MPTLEAVWIPKDGKGVVIFSTTTRHHAGAGIFCKVKKGQQPSLA